DVFRWAAPTGPRAAMFSVGGSYGAARCDVFRWAAPTGPRAAMSSGGRLLRGRALRCFRWAAPTGPPAAMFSVGGSYGAARWDVRGRGRSPPGEQPDRLPGNRCLPSAYIPRVVGHNGQYVAAVRTPDGGGEGQHLAAL